MLVHDLLVFRMRRRRTPYGIAACLLVYAAMTVAPALGQELSLQECIQFALGNSPALREAGYEREEQLLKLRQEKSAWLPSLGAYVDYQHFPSDLPVWFFPEAEGMALSGGSSQGPYPVPVGLPHNLNAGFRLDQTLFDARFFLAAKSAHGLQNLQTVASDKAREELVVRIAGQYYQLSSTMEKSAMLDFNIRRIHRVAGIVGLQAQEGFARESDHLRLLVRLSLLEAERKKLENAIARQYGYLKLSMGMDAEAPLQIHPLREQPAAVGPDSAQIAGLSIEARWMAAQRELLDLEEQRNRMNLFPSLTAYADIRYNAQRSGFNFLEAGDWYQPHVLGMRLAIPVSLLWQSGYDASVTALRRERLEQGMRQQAQKSALEYANARAELENSREAMMGQQKNVDLSRRLLDEAELKYMEGQLSAIELLEAEALYREAQGAFTDSFYAWKTAGLHWLRVNGGLLNAFSPVP